MSTVIKNPEDKFEERICLKCSGRMTVSGASSQGNETYIMYECTECKGIMYSPMNIAPRKKK